MGQLGHRNPNFTLRVCAQETARRDGERDRLKALVEGRDFGHKWAHIAIQKTRRVVRASPKKQKTRPAMSGLPVKRLMGLEPTPPRSPGSTRENCGRQALRPQ